MRHVRILLVVGALASFAVAARFAGLFDRARHDDAVANAVALTEVRVALAQERARDAADAWLRALGEQASSLSEDASEVWLDASDDHGPRARRRSDDASWERLRTLLGAPRVPVGARVAVYEQPEGPGTPPLRLLGWADAARVVRDGLPAWPGRLPAAVGAQELDVAADELAPDDLGWFAREGDEVRLHVQALYTHSYEDPDGDATVVVRAFDASVPVAAPPDLGLEVRCDIVDGAAAPALPAFPVPGSRAAEKFEVRATAGVPGLHPWRLPTPGDRPRLDVRAAPVAPAAPVPAVPAPWVAVGAFLAGVLGLALVARPSRAGAVAPDVTAEAAHELKTPLTVMRGSLEVALRRERDVAEYRDTLAATLDEVKGLQNVVGSVLLLTRGAETPLAREPVDVVALVKAETARVHAVATDREVTFASVRGPRTVVGDPSLLARAVANLLDNAHLHSVAGGGIRVRVEVVDAAVIVSVEDDGPGVPPTRREKVFERFWRGPEVGQRGIPGAGLGLPISRWIAEVHGGSLALDPSVEGRARFVLRLPRAPSSATTP